MRGAVQSSRAGRYTPLAQATHWIAALLMLAVVVLAWIFMAAPAKAAGRFIYITLHKSIGQKVARGPFSIVSAHCAQR